MKNILSANHLWNRAKNANLKVSAEISGGFDLGFDKIIPDDTKFILRDFVGWVEENFYIPVTLWVDFEYRHYLVNRDKSRVGYQFYWSDFKSYPDFEDNNEIPTIRLPVRTENYTVEEILFSFIEAISCYFAWLLNIIDDTYTPDEKESEEILKLYLNSQ